MKPTPRHRLRVLPASEPDQPDEPDDPEFDPGVDLPPSELDRREMMKLLGASAALAGAGGLAGCMKEPNERIVPRIEQPEELVPGVPVSYATSMVLDGYATGLVVQTYEARPVKVEGNPDHPMSLGATTAHHQASILELYDPYRARGPLERTQPDAVERPIALDDVIRSIARRESIEGLWFLLHPQSSPGIAEQIARVRARHPGARFAFYSPLDRRAVHEGARRAFGRPLEAQYALARADVVVALDADFAAAMPGSIRWSRDFAARRRLRSPGGDMSRLYVAEPHPSPTGSLADHRLPTRACDVVRIAAALLARVTGAPTTRGLSAREQLWVNGAAADLRARAGTGLVIVGDRQPPEVHVIGHAINRAIGAIGQTVAFTEPALLEPLGDGLPELVAAMAAGEVKTLVIAEANPVYSAPAELTFTTLLARVPETICAALAENETSRHCAWFVPLSHYMESWGDARAYDGTLSLVQPLIQRLHPSLSVLELLAVFAGDASPDGYRLVRDRYRDASSDIADLAWRRLLQRGFVLDSAFAAVDVALAAEALPSAVVGVPPAAIELSFHPSHAVYDGRFATIAWLQELPKPSTKITWGNAAVMSPATARMLHVGDEDIIRITSEQRDLELPVHVLPGHADGSISVELGYGRWKGGPVADGVGANAYELRTVAAPAYVLGAGVRKLGRSRAIARTQEHFDQHGRHIAPIATLAEYRADPDFTAHSRGAQATWLPEFFADVPGWGMTIDTMICTGCSACVIACQAENNVPVVGREGVIANREMHWLRIDTYREEREGEVVPVNQPMLCQHCESAPCEYVCPVYATQHSPDGLNEMIYNRCIGTRFCSNNCPYKVRRFNWFDYTEDTPESRRLQFNPNVTVRARGVMEKCTYCVQRIRKADIDARKERRELRPGEVVTACQQACPTGAITFGLLTHQGTDAVEWRKEPRHYAVLHHLGTRPRTIYLAKITNPRTD